MAINRGPYNALIDDDGSNTVGTMWNKTQIKTVLLDPIDAAAAFTNQANTFTGNQQVQSAIPRVLLSDTNQPANARLFAITNALQALSITANDDALTTTSGQVLIDRTGTLRVGADVYEKGRTTPMGHWISVPFNAANFSATTGTWTVSSAAMIENVYTLIGNTLIWSLYLAWFTGTSTVAGNPTALRITPPVTLTTPLNSAARIGICYVAGVVTEAYFAPGSYLQISRVDSAAFANGTVGFIGQIVCRIA
jgi:hypothetical protein